MPLFSPGEYRGLDFGPEFLRNLWTPRLSAHASFLRCALSPCSAIDLSDRKDYLRNVHQFFAKRIYHEFGGLMNSKLTHYVSAVHTYRIFAKSETSSNFPVGFTINDQLQHLQFPWTQSAAAAVLERGLLGESAGQAQILLRLLV